MIQRLKWLHFISKNVIRAVILLTMTTDVMIKSLIFHDIFVVMQQFSNILILIDGW